MGLEAGFGEALRTDYFMLREEFTPGVSAFTAGA